MKQVGRGTDKVKEKPTSLVGTGSHAQLAETLQGGIRLCLGHGPFPFMERRSCAGHSSFLVPGLMCPSLFCLSMCAMWHLATPPCLCSPSGGSWVLCLKHRRVACRPPPSARPAGHGGQTPTGEVDLVLSLL